MSHRAAAALNTYGRLPQITGAMIQRLGFDEWWSIIIPEATVNLVSNPSFETGTTGYTANGSSTLTRATTRQRRGAYGLTVTQGNSASSGPRFDISLISGTTYTFSADVWAQGGAEYEIRIDTNAGANVALRRWIGTGRWQRVHISATAPATATHRLAIYPVHISNGRVWYTDGWQCEAKAYPTTYCDGDQQGLIPNQFPVPYRWTGTPHASTSSRIVTTRAGGRVVNVAQFGLTITAVVGLGIGALTTISIPLGLQDGAAYQDTIRQARTFSLGGRISGNSLAQFDARRAALHAALAHDSTGLDQPLVLRYAPRDCTDALETEEVDIHCTYAGGLEGNTSGLMAEDVTIQFTAWQPLVLASGQEGASLSPQTSVSNANSIIQRSAAGIWSAVGTGASGGIDFSQIRTMAIAPDGTLYAGGYFLDAGGSGADYIAKWDGASWSVVGSATALNSAVRKIVFDAAGNMYVGGSFTNAGGVAAADYIAKWDGASWSALGSAFTGSSVNAIAIAPDGTLYAGGDFTNAGGSGADYIAQWDGASWSVVGSATALNNFVEAIAISTDGTVYAGGQFTNAGGVSGASFIAVWDGSAWAALGSGGANSGVVGLGFGLDHTLYIGGTFTTIGGITSTGIVAYTQAGFRDMGSTNAAVYSITTNPINGLVYLGGGGTIWAGQTFSSGNMVWNGFTFTPFDVITGNTIYSIVVQSDGSLFAGFVNTPPTTLTVANATTVTNTGTAPVAPILTINGPSSGSSAIYSIRNETTNVGIYFNLSLLAGERATYNLETGAFGSNIRPDLSGAIIPGSNLADFVLVPGANTISFLAASNTVTASLYWTPRFIGPSDAPR